MRRDCVSIRIVSDHIHEEDEEFEVVLEDMNLPDYAAITPDVARVKIINVESELLCMHFYLFLLLLFSQL